MIRLIFLDLLTSLLDIGFLVGLIYVVHFYTTGNYSVPFSFFPFTLFAKYPLSLIIIFFLLFALKNWACYLVFRKQYKFVYGVASRLSENNLYQFLQGTYDAHVQTNSSVPISKISRHPIEFGQHVLASVQQITGQCILIIITIVAILIFNPVLFLLLFVILTPPILFIGSFIKRKLNAVRKTAKPLHEKALQYLQEALAGYIECNVYDRKDFFVHRYSTYQTKFNTFLSRQLVIQNLPYRFMEVFALFGLLLLIVLNFYGNNSGSIGIVTIGTFMAAAYKIIPGIVKILNSLGQIKTFSYTVTSLLNNQAQSNPKKEGVSTEISVVAMKNIHFSYKGKAVLNGFSMKMEKGDFIGLTGMSGKGKTTIINLILGFLDPQAGVIEFNNSDTTTVDRQRYRTRISYVKQDVFLIHDTILTNITLHEKEADEYRLENAVKATGLDNFTSSYPERLLKIITEHGRNISGGQKQRIVISRALYKEADLIILDEPFNELDRQSEDNLLEHCRSLAAAGKIIILVTHNKESLSYCSKIVSLDEN